MALAWRAICRSRPYRLDEPRFRGKKAKIRRQHADNLSLETIHEEVAAQDIWIGREALAPAGVGQDDDAVIFRYGRFLFGKGTTQRQIDAERRKKVRRDAQHSDLLGGPRIADDFGVFGVDG